MDFFQEALFKTDSIKISKADKPFWYTSGTIGPYFINTHFLYGSQQDAEDLLNFINQNKDNKPQFFNDLTEKVLQFYNTNSLFKNIIDFFYQKLSQLDTFQNCNYISGGERRDWFFSPVIAHLSQKKHLFIYKDLSIYENGEPVKDLNQAKVCHVCDLITKASSHERAWIPSIKSVNGNLTLAATIVDRDEGGLDLLANLNIETFTAVTTSNQFFNHIMEHGIITKDQLELIFQFKKDPMQFGKNFILNHTQFIKESLNDSGLQKKVQICIDKNPYQLDFTNLL